MQIHASSNSPSSASKADEAHPGELCEPGVEHDATTRLSSSSSFSATQRAPSSKRKFAASDAHPHKRQPLLAAGGVGAERAPAEGQDWRELFLSADKDAASTASVAEAVVLGHSLLLLDGLASAHECSALLSEAVAVAARVRRENFGQREEAGEGHFSGSEETQSEEEERADTGSEAAGHEAAGEEAGRIAVDLPPGTWDGVCRCEKVCYVCVCVCVCVCVREMCVCVCVCVLGVRERERKRRRERDMCVRVLGVWRCVTGMGRGKSVSVSSTLDNLAPNLLLTHTHSRLSDAEQPLAHTPASRAHAQHAGTPSATYASLIRHLIRNTRIRLPVARMLSHQAPVKALLRLC